MIIDHGGSTDIPEAKAMTTIYSKHLTGIPA